MKLKFYPTEKRKAANFGKWEMTLLWSFLDFGHFSILLEGNLGVENDDINFLETNQNNSPSTPWEIVNFSILTLFFHLSFPKNEQSSELKHFWTKY